MNTKLNELLAWVIVVGNTGGRKVLWRGNSKHPVFYLNLFLFSCVKCNESKHVCKLTAWTGLGLFTVQSFHLLYGINTHFSVLRLYMYIEI